MDCTLEQATAHSRCVRAVPQSNGLFSRATRVDRVLIEGDVPAVYALKDVWRQTCRRRDNPIHQYCTRTGKDSRGMVRSLELFSSHSQHGHSYRQTNSTDGDNDLAERRHLRALITPVGIPLTTYPNTKSLVNGLRAAVHHHLIAYEAGVLHRNVNEGNIIFDEVTLEAFLVSFDYAELTPRGLERLSARVLDANEDKYTTSDKRFNELSGTFPFLAIQLLRATPESRVIHNAGHDLESVYWLLVWIILRHTEHTLDSNACHELFDRDLSTAANHKDAWLSKPTPLDANHPLYIVAEHLRHLVTLQNPVVRPPPPAIPGLPPIPSRPVDQAVEISHALVLAIFDAVLSMPGWPENDKARPFVAQARSLSNSRARRSEARIPSSEATSRLQFQVI
ncbi:hypothetical protein B0H17DRAFT_1044187 [Mycena rosella]|uniref:Fungal-type protein kinase domain-containing protein n=1 Tax=Mycena rosella TaxID=1033263 RepID=A0AAD7GQ25_MYCRO|nr:hypothetical protein B0H17DRAFT_1044187 [Mycena rosella]